VSAIVKVKNGGRKKKLKHSMPAIEAAMASIKPQPVATARVANKNVIAIVVLFA